MFDYDAELVHYNAQLRTAADVRPDDRVLDIGCGTGQATREAAAAAGSGSAMGVDTSPAMVERAQTLGEGIDNLTFERADAQTHPFAPECFTLGISRFGTMFFSDPTSAFANVGSALRPGSSLVQLVWQSADQQEWMTAVHRARTGGSAALWPSGGAFSLADPTVATGALTAAGFSEVEVVDVREPVFYGHDAAAARDSLIGLGMVDATTGPAQDRLMTMLESHDAGEGVWFDSAAWLITARWR